MKQNLHPANQRVFQVELGHLVLTVTCRDEQEAVRLARRKVCEEFPRLWDVVHRMEESRFVVRPVREAG